MGGALWSRGALFHLLQNRHYLGEIVHKDITHPGLHPAIIDTATFDAVQAKLETNRVDRRTRTAKAASHLLTGRVFDGEGRRFSPTFSTGRTGHIHRYYVMTDIQLGRSPTLHPDAITRVGAEALDSFVLAHLRRLTDRPVLAAADVAALLQRIELRSSDTHLIVHHAALVGDDHPDLALQDLEARLGAGQRLVVEAGGDLLRIALPQRMKLRGGRSWSSFTGNAPALPKVDPALVDALQRAHCLAANWTSGKNSDYQRRLRNLSFLSPAIQRAILEGRLPKGLRLSDLLLIESPMHWSAQQDWLQSVATRG